MTFTVETANGEISGHVSGDPEAPAVLMLHGGPAVTNYMEMLAPEVSGWRAIYYQQRGLAPSATEGPFTVEQHVADAIVVLDAVGVDRAVLVGHSWGTHLALQLAVTHPERVTGLVLIDGPGVMGDGGVPEMGKNLFERLPAQSRLAFAEVQERLNSPDATDDDASASLRLVWPGYFGSMENTLPYPPEMRTSLAGYVGTMGSMMENLASGFADSLTSVTVPVIFLLGGGSPMPVSQGIQAAEFLPNSSVSVVPGAGHLVWYEAPGVVAGALASLRTGL
jgi:pimeloyl-ACP methyl ester carboxylesterase